MYVMEMVGFKAIHCTSDAPWRSLLDAVLGSYTEEEFLNHLTLVHGLSKDRLEVTPEGEIFLHPAP